jgi:hypothetical protein
MAACIGLAIAGFATVNSLDDPADRASFIGLTMLLILPLSVVADIDWERGRRRALGSLLPLVAVAAVSALLVPVPSYVAHTVRAHQLGAFVLATSALAIWMLTRRLLRANREGAPDSAG